TRTVPIVFPVVADPVAAGYVETLSRPGGNATGLGGLRIQPSRLLKNWGKGAASVCGGGLGFLECGSLPSGQA
ncbi:MAG: hypothetical protein WBE93_04115, partial [Pseudolabrys sp.]